jgi:hypothetical protein
MDHQGSDVRFVPKADIHKVRVAASTMFVRERTTAVIPAGGLPVQFGPTIM